MEHFYLNMASGNKKTGVMPVSTSHCGTCPTACPLKAHGCYAKGGPLAIHWRAVSDGSRGVEWEEFLSQIRKIPKGTLWRHNQSGDLVGKANRLNATALKQLAQANKGKRGYSYTHYPLTARNVKILQEANENGFTVNVSTNRIQEVDKAMGKGLPVVTVLPVGTIGRTLQTAKGNTVLVCPASLGKEIHCNACGLCQNGKRSYAIGFIAHGIQKKNLGE